MKEEVKEALREVDNRIRSANHSRRFYGRPFLRNNQIATFYENLAKGTDDPEISMEASRKQAEYLLCSGSTSSRRDVFAYRELEEAKSLYERLEDNEGVKKVETRLALDGSEDAEYMIKNNRQGHLRDLRDITKYLEYAGRKNESQRLIEIIQEIEDLGKILSPSLRKQGQKIRETI
jgi:hypothetical protein